MDVTELLAKALEGKHGWSRAYARGYAAGETLRVRGNRLPSYAITGRDEWATGFRAAHYVGRRPD